MKFTSDYQSKIAHFEMKKVAMKSKTTNKPGNPGNNFSGGSYLSLTQAQGCPFVRKSRTPIFSWLLLKVSAGLAVGCGEEGGLGDNSSVKKNKPRIKAALIIQNKG